MSAAVAAPARALVVFARAPEPGRVKTRLAAGIGDAAALAVYRELGARVVRAVAPLPRCRTVVAFTPPHEGALVHAWLGALAPVALEAQGEGDLGARMAGAVAARRAAGAEQVVVIGTDCPDVDAALVEEAFAALAGADVVFGPALDGGYYLVGTRAPAGSAVFEAVPWSAPDTLAVSQARAAAAGLSVALLRPLRDVDTAADWEAWTESRVTESRVTESRVTGDG